MSELPFDVDLVETAREAVHELDGDESEYDALTVAVALADQYDAVDAANACRALLKWASKYGDTHTREEAVQAITAKTEYNKSTAEEWRDEIDAESVVDRLNVLKVTRVLRPGRQTANFAFDIEFPDGHTGEFVYKGWRGDGEQKSAFESFLSGHMFDWVAIEDWDATMEAMMNRADQRQTKEAAPMAAEQALIKSILQGIGSSEVTLQYDEYYKSSSKQLIDPDTGEMWIRNSMISNKEEACPRDVDREHLLNLLDYKGLLADVPDDENAVFTAEREQITWRFDIDALRETGIVDVEMLLEEARKESGTGPIGGGADDDTDDTDDDDDTDHEIMTDGGVTVPERGASAMDADIYKTFQGLPGTGKTYTLMETLADEIADGTPVGSIAASTFRRSMAAEFEHRARQVVEDLPDNNWFGTTHSLCYRLVGYESTDVADHTDRAAFCDEIGVSYNGGGADDGQRGNIGNTAFGARSFCINTLRDPRTGWRASNEDQSDLEAVEYGIGFETFNDEWERYKDENGLLDFDDMLQIVHDQGLVPNVDVLIEDEFQDKSPLQVEIFKQWADEIDRVYVAGDPYQALYGFAGTDPAYMEQAIAAADEAVTLDTSYRFGPELWAYATEILERARYDVPDIYPDDESTVERISYDQYKDIVRRRKDEDSLHLVRCSYMGSHAADVLQRIGIPFSSKMGVRWTDTMVDRYNGIVKLANTARASGQYGGLRAQTDLSNISASEALEAARAMRAANIRGTKSSAVSLLEKTADPDDEEHLRSDVNLMKLFDTAAIADNVVADGEVFSSHVVTTSGVGGERIRQRLASACEQLGGEPIDDVNHAIMTIHAAKGAQAENVYLFDGVSRAVMEDVETYTFRDKPEARVFFVGATRAKTRLYVVESPEPLSFDLPEVPS